jgi:hypothetical protein
MSATDKIANTAAVNAHSVVLDIDLPLFSGRKNMNHG